LWRPLIKPPAEEVEFVRDHGLVLGPVVDVEVVDAGIGAQLAHR
jgi:hypothetical protein